MESYKTSWYPEEPLDLSMKVNSNLKKTQHSNDSPLCMVKSCACALPVSEKDSDPSLFDKATTDELSSDGSSKGSVSGDFTMNEKSGMTTKEICSPLQPIYSKKAHSPPSMYKRDLLLDAMNGSRSQMRGSPSLSGGSPHHMSYDQASVSPSTSSGSQFTPVSSYLSVKSGEYDMRPPNIPAMDRDYEVQYERESLAREPSFYRSSGSPRVIRHEFESSFGDRGVNKGYSSGSNRDVEKTTFVCMDTGKYYESNSLRHRGRSGSSPKQVSSPKPVSGSSFQIKAPTRSADSFIQGGLVSEEGKPPVEHIRYASDSALVYGEDNGGSYIHVNSHRTEGRSLSSSVKYSTDAAKQDSPRVKQKEKYIWSPASSLCYKQYQASLKRQFAPSGVEFNEDQDGSCSPSEGKRFCDQSDKSGCQNWLVDETNKAERDRCEKTHNLQKNSWIPKFEHVPMSASTETLSLNHLSGPYIVSKASISENDEMVEPKKELEENVADSENTLEHTNRKMCALDYLISKVLVERIDVPFKACNTEINRIYRGECKGRLRLVDLIELQVEASLKV